ncbi:MAG: type II secretion system F family protein [Lachnospiraceae bacterium]
MPATVSKRSFSYAETALFCNQIALMLQAGISTYEGVMILYDDEENKKYRLIYQRILKRLEVGDSFYHALMDTYAFPEYLLNMVHLGENAGKLDDVLFSLGQYYEREDRIRENIRQAVSYPILMISMILAVLFILVTKVLPIFSDVYQQLGDELTGFALKLLQIGMVLTHYTTFLIIIFIILITIVLFFAKTKIGQKLLSSALICQMFSKNFRHSIAAARFCDGIALALNSGLNLIDGMILTRAIVNDKEMEKKIDRCIKELEDGESLSVSLTSSGIFNRLYTRMLSIAFKSGNVDKVLRKIAEGYEEQANNSILRFLTILEPSLIILLSLIVGMILLTVLLPLLGIMTSLG